MIRSMFNAELFILGVLVWLNLFWVTKNRFSKKCKFPACVQKSTIVPKLFIRISVKKNKNFCAFLFRYFICYELVLILDTEWELVDRISGDQNRRLKLAFLRRLKLFQTCSGDRNNDFCQFFRRSNFDLLNFFEMTAMFRRSKL